MTTTLTAWATTSTSMPGADAGITVEPVELDEGVAYPSYQPVATEVVGLALDGEDGSLDEDAADRLLDGMGYSRITPWRASGGQWGAEVEPVELDEGVAYPSYQPVATEVVGLALDGEDGSLDEDAADRLLAGMGYSRITPWRESGGQWGAEVEPTA